MVDKQESILQSIQTRSTTQSLIDPGFDAVDFYMNEQKEEEAAAAAAAIEAARLVTERKGMTVWLAAAAIEKEKNRRK